MGIIATDINDVIQDAKHHNIPRGLIGVIPKSVAQLVGYDADGNEIYEGDKFRAPDMYPLSDEEFEALEEDEREYLYAVGAVKTGLMLPCGSIWTDKEVAKNGYDFQPYEEDR